MLYYLIVCRSLTYAQRTASALERAGITAHIMRSLKASQGGCSHSVKVSQRNLPDALRILHRTELDPRRVYITAGDGSSRRCSCDLSGQRGHLSAKPPAVARACSYAISHYASPGRGGHKPAMDAAAAAFACREAAARLFQVPKPEQVVFTNNATHGLNIAIKALVRQEGQWSSPDMSTTRSPGRSTPSGCDGRVAADNCSGRRRPWRHSERP